jgi:hypothetical protein
MNRPVRSFATGRNPLFTSSAQAFSSSRVLMHPERRNVNPHTK